MESGISFIPVNGTLTAKSKKLIIYQIMMGNMSIDVSMDLFKDILKNEVVFYRKENFYESCNCIYLSCSEIMSEIRVKSKISLSEIFL